jgi:hypothetical protein
VVNAQLLLTIAIAAAIATAMHIIYVFYVGQNCKRVLHSQQQLQQLYHAM